MDTSKLLNVFSDLSNEEFSTSITKTFESLLTNISAGDPEAIAVDEKLLKESFESSVVNNYVPSDLEILHFIKGEKYFGLAAYHDIQEILHRNTYNLQKTIDDLKSYKSDRDKFNELVAVTRNSLDELKFEAYYPRGQNYQVGLLLPDAYTKNKIINVTRELNRWDKVFKTFKEMVGEPSEDTAINFVSNGTLEFFIDNSPQIGFALAFAIDKIIKVYKNIVEIRQAREKLKELGIPASEQKVVEKQEKEHISKELEKISTELIKEFAIKKLESGRLNELKIAVKGHIVYMAKCIDNGILIEINPPYIGPPEILKQKETEENKDKQKAAKIDYDKKLKEIEMVQKSMETLKTLGNFGIDIGKFLTNGDDLPDGDV